MGEAKQGAWMQEEDQADEQKKGAGDGDQEKKKGEEKRMMKKQPVVDIVLRIDIHCIGCANKIERSILKVRGVEEVKIDMVEEQVVVKGMVDPRELRARLQRKTKREVTVLFPQLSPSTTDLQEGDNNKTEEALVQVDLLNTVVLNVNMHCEACALQLAKKILKMRGVHSVNAEFSSSRVTVIGTMDADKLTNYVYTRTRKMANVQSPISNNIDTITTSDDGKKTKGDDDKKPEAAADVGELPEAPAPKSVSDQKQAEGKGKGEDDIVHPDQAEKKIQINQKEEDQVAEKKEVIMISNDQEPIKKDAVAAAAASELIAEIKKLAYYYPPPPPIYVFDSNSSRSVYAPQLFSDENPNACCIS